MHHKSKCEFREEVVFMTLKHESEDSSILDSQTFTIKVSSC